jgi:hypothetical protein
MSWLGGGRRCGWAARWDWEISWDYGNTFQRLSFGQSAVLAGAVSFDVSNIPAGYYMLCLRSSATHFRSPIIIIR